MNYVRNEVTVAPDVADIIRSVCQPARPRDAAGGIMFYRCYFLFLKCRTCHSTTGGRIATQMEALTPSIKKLLRQKFAERWQ